MNDFRDIMESKDVCNFLSTSMKPSDKCTKSVLGSNYCTSETHVISQNSKLFQCTQKEGKRSLWCFLDFYVQWRFKSRFHPNLETNGLMKNVEKLWIEK